MKKSYTFAILVLILLVSISSVLGECKKEINYYVKGSATGLNAIKEMVEREDGCHGEEELVEVFCRGEEIAYEYYNCTKEKKICDDGKCVKYECTELNHDSIGNYGIKGGIIFKENDKIIHSEDINPREDSCSTIKINYLHEWSCKDNKPYEELINCAERGGTCNKGTCLIVDLDADSIPDQYENEKCLDTSIGDMVDTRKSKNNVKNEFYGCSCSQGAEEVGDIEIGLINCKKYLNSYPYKENLKTRDGIPLHCQNSIKDFDEILTDCGNTCGPCSTICKKLNEGGSLDITFIPVGYTSSKDQNSKNNFNDWVKRSEEEKNNLLTTPPFNNGHITIWRLDAFRTNKAFEEKWLNNDENSFRSAWQDFRGICPGSKNTPNDLVYFLATGGIGSMSAGYYAAILVDEKVNSISHETGHTVCKLKDEYILFPESLIENQPINCDKDPVLLSDGSYKCKWQYDPNSDDEREKLARINYPYDYIYAKDAGCIPGCYNQKYYRPAFPETSIMNTEVRLGVGTFNEISKQACLYELNKYKK